MLLDECHRPDVDIAIDEDTWRLSLATRYGLPETSIEVGQELQPAMPNLEGVLDSFNDGS